MGNASSALRTITGTHTPNSASTTNTARDGDIESARTTSPAAPETDNGNANPAPVDTTAGNGLYLGPQFFRNVTNSIDLSFLSPLTRRVNPPQMHQTTTVKCPVNLNRNSLQLIVEEGSTSRHRLQFLFDTTESGTIKLFYGATEDGIHTGGETSYRAVYSTSEIRFERGLSQAFEQPKEDYIDLSVLNGEFTHDSEQKYYPVVIVVQSDTASTIKLDREDQKKSPTVTQQTTFANIIQCADDTFVIKPIKQKILCSGRTFIVHDIFGLENGENETGRECVICMSDARDTAVLPCRHLCLCSACAEELRQQSNKCPICRSTVKHMVEIKIGKELTKEEREEREGEEEYSYSKGTMKPILVESWTQETRDDL
ncbi:hypothetical protein PROFUN_14641 [Planoprotostelium fungivorum]|uniref:RING-type E3 ubiquitin transferase n=1 Tax=Planoprotostelium fungivorum TaxID=1890364 RepID=A0A2P6MZC1_9EUKA|nr:hypothetical protein PROFUN_14641 [Planoprotostelium fungivorum]